MEIRAEIRRILESCESLDANIAKVEHDETAVKEARSLASRTRTTLLGIMSRLDCLNAELLQTELEATSPPRRERERLGSRRRQSSAL